jgi:hypothetical protein
VNVGAIYSCSFGNGPVVVNGGIVAQGRGFEGRKSQVSR